MTTKYQFERILEDTTIEILKREFGIQAFAIPGSTGVWVESRIPPAEVDAKRVEGDDATGDGVTSQAESIDSSLRRRNVRRIATVHASVTDDITQWGVSIHVGQPDPTVDAWARSTNPWIPIRQHHTTTSIAAELSYMKSTASPLGPSKYLLTHFNHNAMPLRAGQGYIPYSSIKAESGRRCSAPLGMDNRDISTAWTYEFARQLGMSDGHVDHYSMVDTDETNATNLPTKAYGAGFRFKGVFSEDVMNGAYRQVDVPSIQVGKNETVAPGIVESSMRLEHHDQRIDSFTHEGWLLSWPLWESTLIKKLDEAICGGPCDTRLRAYELQKQVSSRLQRRRNELQQVKDVEEEWRRDMPHLVRRPLSDSIIRELADRSREMESILKTVRMGSKSEKLLDSTIQIRRLLERRFAGAFSGNAGAPERLQNNDSPAMEAAAGEAPTTPVNTSTGEPQASDFDLEEMKFNETIRRLQDRVKDRVTPRPPREHVEFTKPKAEKHREKAERRRVYAEEMRARRAKAQYRRLDTENTEPEQQQRGPIGEQPLEAAKERGAAGSKEGRASGASQFLPKTQHIGGS
jgi:hypothetical protein